MPEKEELIKLKKELAEMQEFHAAAWDMYGSELCAFEMADKERALEIKIKKLEECNSSNK